MFNVGESHGRLSNVLQVENVCLAVGLRDYCSLSDLINCQP